MPTTTEDFLRAALPPRLTYPSFALHIHHRPSFDKSTHDSPDIFSKIICPYNSDAFESFLIEHNLLEVYPHLIHNLRFGFPLGKMPDLSSTAIIPNHPSARLHMDAIDTYLKDEMDADRMSGPFSKYQVERILRGPFQSSPLIVSISTQAPGEPDKIRVCRHLSKASRHGPAVNSFIEKEDFPTRFDTAARVAETVSPSTFLPSALALSFPHTRVLLHNCILLHICAFLHTRVPHTSCIPAYPHTSSTNSIFYLPPLTHTRVLHMLILSYTDCCRPSWHPSLHSRH